MQVKLAFYERLTTHASTPLSTSVFHVSSSYVLKSHESAQLSKSVFHLHHFASLVYHLLSPV